ncbi:aryl-alcohol dehydrogenase [Dendrothele bispora CBS 962.96]|uniref:Aryl-alcohol dehydrogenase n=1 Tax=Dendrothele bispora (strain CBS 962.96) TaxID=1314807 RepID=A0A4S8MN96_DENBC|nr:aryl-alcohol dehydrogenase [Dendrothele bispora CBS 962.96]
MFTVPPQPPRTKLGRYRQLAPRAAIHVSPICLGGMSIGDQWTSSFGAMDKESSFKLLDAYFDAGGNFIDTANIYQNGTSEQFIGEWMAKRKNRDQMVLATKYSNYTYNGSTSIEQRVNYVGNGTKSLKLSVEASLERFKTSYIDLLYVHWWDSHTSVEEMMDALHNLVAAGKVLYLGISDSPAWFVVKANAYARSVGKTPFVVYQGEYSILKRDMEREIIPMCISEGLGIHPWGVLASGHIRSNEEEKRRLESGEKGRQLPDWNLDWIRSPEEVKVCDGLEKVAKEVGAKNIGALAIAYVLHKTQYMFPIIGGRKVEHLTSNIEALDISLTPEQISYMDGLKPFEFGSPYDIFGKNGEYPMLVTIHAAIDNIPRPVPITPTKQQ